MGKRTGLFLILSTIFLGLVLPALAIGAEEGTKPASPANAIRVFANQSSLLDTDFNIKRVSVAKPEIADVLVISPRQFLIVGKAQGTTSLVYWNENEVPTTVDVILTTVPPEGKEKISKVILENMQVLAAGQIVEQKENKPITVNTVTLSVTPDEAERLALASNDGVIQLTLRNFMDFDNVVTIGATKARLLSAYRPASPPEESKPEAKKRYTPRKRSSPVMPVAKKTFTVEVIKGNKRSEEKFQ